MTFLTDLGVSKGDEGPVVVLGVFAAVVLSIFIGGWAIKEGRLDSNDSNSSSNSDSDSDSENNYPTARGITKRKRNKNKKSNKKSHKNRK